MDKFGYADRPIENIDNDSLNMSDYVNGLSDFIKCCETPMTIAIKGEWGSGKTSLMRMIQNNLTKKTTKSIPKATVTEQRTDDASEATVTEQRTDDASEATVTEQRTDDVSEATVTKQTTNSVLEEPVIIPVWFDTWKFSAMELGNQLAVSMLGEILHALDCDSSTIRAMLGGIAKLTNATLPLVTEVLTGFDSLGEMLRGVLRVNEKERYGTEIRELQNRFHEIVQRKIKREKARRKNDQEFLELTKRPDFADNASSKARSYYFGRAKEEFINNKYDCLAADRVVIFIDDLDRIQPDKAVDLLEILKAFLDCPNSVFVLAIDFELVSLGVNIKYKNNLSAEKNKDFFDKMVQLPFTMPITNYDLDKYIEKLNLSKNDIRKEEIKHFIELSVGANPRKIKRIFNTYYLNSRNALNKYDKKMNKEFVNKCVFALACLQEQYPDFLAFLANNNFDRFIFEPFLQPDVTAMYQYHDIFEKRDETYIKQQLEGLRRFIPEFEKIFSTLTEAYKSLIEETNQKYDKHFSSEPIFIEIDSEAAKEVYEQRKDEETSIGDKDEDLAFRQEIERLQILNKKDNYKNFKEIIKLISVSNLGMLINPSLQDVAGNEEWLLREVNIELAKRIIGELWIFERDKKRIKWIDLTPDNWRFEVEKDRKSWSILTPINTKHEIKFSDITSYRKYTSDMHFDYTFGFKIHEDSAKIHDIELDCGEIHNTNFDEREGFICFDIILHVYPNNDLQKDKILSLMGEDPLLLMKKPNIKMSQDGFLYHYVNVIKIFKRFNDKMVYSHFQDYNITKKSLVVLITSVLENTLLLFQSRCKEGKTVEIIGNLLERVELFKAFNYQVVYEQTFTGINDLDVYKRLLRGFNKHCVYKTNYFKKVMPKAKSVAEKAKSIVIANNVANSKADNNINKVVDKSLLAQIDNAVILYYFLKLDSEPTLLSLLRKVFGSVVVDAWQTLLFKKSEDINSFINRIAHNLLASVIIVAEIEENLSKGQSNKFLHGKYRNLNNSELETIKDRINDFIGHERCI